MRKVKAGRPVERELAGPLSTELLDAMKQQGITQHELARRLRVSQGGISRNLRSHSLRVLDKIAEALGLRVVVSLAPRKRGRA